MTSDTAYLYVTRFERAAFDAIRSVFAARGIELAHPETGMVRLVDELGEGRQATEEDLLTRIDELGGERPGLAWQWWLDATTDVFCEVTSLGDCGCRVSIGIDGIHGEDRDVLLLALWEAVFRLLTRTIAYLVDVGGRFELTTDSAVGRGDPSLANVPWDVLVLGPCFAPHARRHPPSR